MTSVVKGTWGLDPSNEAYIGPEAEFIPNGDYCKSLCVKNWMEMGTYRGIVKWHYIDSAAGGTNDNTKSYQ